MRNKLLKFWYANLYPFSNLDKVVSDFEIEENIIKPHKFKNVSISKNDCIKNSIKRKKNLEQLEKKGGIKRYLINWIGITILYSVVVDYLIEPVTIYERVPVGIIGFVLMSIVGALSLFLFLLRNKK